MKLKINFIFPAEKLRIALLYCMWSGIFIMAMLSLLFFFTAKSMREEMPSIKKGLEDSKQQYAEVKSNTIFPDKEKLAETLKKVSEINRLKMTKSAGITEILYRLESITPDSISFLSFTYNSEDSSIMIEARTKDGRAVTQYIKKLEKEPMLLNVRLEKQEQHDTTMAGQVTDFTIKAEENPI